MQVDRLAVMTARIALAAMLLDASCIDTYAAEVQSGWPVRDAQL
jgi:hypothetical protein